MDWNLHQQDIWWEVVAHSSTLQHLKSDLHGIRHWTRVRHNAMRIGRMTEGCDLVVADLFALFHDSQRESEGVDHNHGERGWMLFCKLGGEKIVSPPQQAILKRALIEHDWGTITHDPTIGVCWDADRLDLPRVGITPNPRLLSTRLARLEVEVRP